jgi:hypothetical protein
MAQGEGPMDVAKRESSQPRVGRQNPSPRDDRGDTGSPDAMRNAAMASAMPTADVVSMVSRDVNGNPAQSENFVVMVDDDAPDEIKDAHYNKAGEEVGAQKFSREEHLMAVDPLDYEKRSKEESEQLHRINFRPHEVGGR